MEKLRKLWPLLLCGATVVLILCAVLLLGREAPEETQPSTTQASASARQLYKDAWQAVRRAENLVLEYTLEESRTIGTNSFSRNVTGNAAFSQLRKDNMTAVVEETLDFGAYSCTYAEAYCEGTAYAVVNDYCFRAELTAGEFADRQIPAVLLTETLYESVEMTAGEDITTLLFSNPTALESWVGQGELISASGTAVLDSRGNLLQTNYRAEYRTEKVQYRLELTVDVTTPKSLNLSAMHIAHNRESVLLAELDAPRYLVQVVADVFSAEQIVCTMEEAIHSDAIPLTYNQSSRIALQGAGETLSAQATYDATMSNDRGSLTEVIQTEQFRDGVYTVTVDGGEPAADESVTAEFVRQYCEDTILSGLFAVKYVQSAAVRADENLLHLEFGANDSFGKDLTAQLSGLLQADLEALAQNAKTHLAVGHLTVDMETGLPVSMGMALQREHTIDGMTYQLSYTLEESLSFEAE